MNSDFLNKIKAGPGRAEADSAALQALGRLPWALYGDGWYAPYVREFLGRRGLQPAACFVDDRCTASPGTVTFDEVSRRFGQFNVVIGFANARVARQKLAARACGQIAGVYFFDAIGPLLNYHLDRPYVERHSERFGAVHELFSDELSRQTYLAFIDSALGGDTEPLYAVLRKDQYFPPEIISLSDSEVFVDGGAYTGDTLLTFLRKAGNKYARCCAFEPEPENTAKLHALHGRQRWRDVSIIDRGLWSRPETQPFAPAHATTASAIAAAGSASIAVDTIDNLAPDATYIKLDVEGAELEALKGAAQTIRRNRPKLAVCLYHKPGDLIEIPLFIKSLVPEYKFYLRQHQPVTCELVLYAVI